MIFLIFGTWREENFPEYVRRARRTLTEHATGYEGVEILERYYTIGERRFLSIAEAESGEALMKVIAPYLDICDIEVKPALRGSGAVDVWLAD